MRRRKPRRVQTKHGEKHEEKGGLKHTKLVAGHYGLTGQLKDCPRLLFKAKLGRGDIIGKENYKIKGRKSKTKVMGKSGGEGCEGGERREGEDTGERRHALVCPNLWSLSSSWMAATTFSVVILASTKPLGTAVGARIVYLLGFGRNQGKRERDWIGDGTQIRLVFGW